MRLFYRYTVTFFLALITVFFNMPTAKATVGEVFCEKHTSEDTFRLRTRVTDKSRKKPLNNSIVVSGYIYENKADALADKNIFRWFYSSRGPEQPKKPADVWFTNSPRLDNGWKAVVQYVDSMAQVDLDAQCSGQPKLSECKPTLDVSHKRQLKQRVVKIMGQSKDEEVDGQALKILIKILFVFQ